MNWKEKLIRINESINKYDPMDDEYSINLNNYDVSKIKNILSFLKNNNIDYDLTGKKLTIDNFDTLSSSKQNAFYNLFESYGKRLTAAKVLLENTKESALVQNWKEKLINLKNSFKEELSDSQIEKKWNGMTSFERNTILRNAGLPNSLSNKSYNDFTKQQKIELAKRMDWNYRLGL